MSCRHDIVTSDTSDLYDYPFNYGFVYYLPRHQELFLLEVNNREIIMAIETNNDRYFLQNWTKSSRCFSNTSNKMDMKLGLLILLNKMRSQKLVPYFEELRQYNRRYNQHRMKSLFEHDSLIVSKYLTTIYYH